MSKMLKFYDVKKEKTFKTSNYKLKSIKTPKGMRKQVVTTAPSGVKACRFVPKDFKK